MYTQCSLTRRVEQKEPFGKTIDDRDSFQIRTTVKAGSAEESFGERVTNREWRMNWAVRTAQHLSKT